MLEVQVKSKMTDPCKLVRLHTSYMYAFKIESVKVNRLYMYSVFQCEKRLLGNNIRCFGPITFTLCMEAGYAHAIKFPRSTPGHGTHSLTHLLIG